MSYISLYRKYRSQSFDDVIGQDHVVRTIRNAISAGRIGQGYLFCGSRGTGKTTVARLIAKALNCMEGPTPDPCNKCEACLSIMAGNAVDVIEMDAASNRGVDDVDSLREGVKYPPMRLRYKVYIIDEAHQLSPQAKDAFLKTLEEPPPHAVFILATTESHKIPITIRSRCQQFDFRRGTIEEICGRLKYVVTSEGATIDDDSIDLVARSANGSYRDSLSLLEQVLAYTEGTISSKDVYTVLGMVDEEVLLELGDVLASTDTAAAFDIADRLLREGRDVREMLKSLAGHFRDLLALKVGADKRRKTNDRWRSQAENYAQDQLVRIVEIFAAAEKDMKWNEQHRLGLEMALLKAMARPKETAPVQHDVYTSIPERPVQPVVKEQPPTPAVISDTKKTDEYAPVKKAAKKEQPVTVDAEPSVTVPDISPIDSAGESVGKSVTLSSLQQEWPKILRHLQKCKQGSVAAAIRSGRLVDLSGNVLTLGFGKSISGFHLARVEADAPKISTSIEAVMGAKLRVVSLIMDGDNMGPEYSAEPSFGEAVQHPLLDDVLEKFGGTVVDDHNDPWKE